jgi:hypothetical protein
VDYALGPTLAIYAVVAMILIVGAVLIGRRRR